MKQPSDLRKTLYDKIVVHPGITLTALLSHAQQQCPDAPAIPAPLGKLLVQYLGLFRPAQRQLSFDRVSNLLNELLPMIAEAKIERGGRIWSAPQEYWAMALSEMIAKRDNLTLPLKSHGYLLAIIEGYNSKAEAKQETSTEQQRGGRTPVGAPSPVRPDASTGSAQGTQGVSKGEPKPRTQMPQTVKAALIKGGLTMPANPKAIVLTVLSRHIGRGNGISVRGLEQQLDMLPRCIRSYISDLREEGHAICGTPKDGYYIAATHEELTQTCEFLRHRAMHSLVLEAKLRRIPLPDLLGQLHLPT